MAIQIQQGYSFTAIADGVSSSFSIDLSLPPLGINFQGKLPASISGSNFGSIATYTATLTGSTVNFTFPTAPASGSYSVGLALLF